MHARVRVCVRACRYIYITSMMEVMVGPKNSRRSLLCCGSAIARFSCKGRGGRQNGERGKESD